MSPAVLTPDPLLAAQAEVDRSRAALLATAHALQARLQPRTLAGEAWQAAKVKGADLAEDAVDAVKRRPVAASGLIAALTLFLAREPIKDGAVRLYDAMTSKDDQPPAKPAKRRRRSARATIPTEQA